MLATMKEFALIASTVRPGLNTSSALFIGVPPGRCSNGIGFHLTLGYIPSKRFCGKVIFNKTEKIGTWDTPNLKERTDYWWPTKQDQISLNNHGIPWCLFKALRPRELTLIGGAVDMNIPQNQSSQGPTLLTNRWFKWCFLFLNSSGFKTASQLFSVSLF